MRSVKLPSLHSSMKPVTYYASTGSKELSFGYSFHVLVCTSVPWGDLWVQLVLESTPHDYYHHPHYPNQLPITWNTLSSCFYYSRGGSGWFRFWHRIWWIFTPWRALRVRGAHLPEDLQLSLQEKLVLEALTGHLPVHRKTWGRKWACWWHTNQRGKAGYQHS